MSSDATLDESQPPLPFAEAPTQGFASFLWNAVKPGGVRIDMRSGLERLYREHGPVVVQNGGVIRLVNLFGPDANRYVLMDRDDNFSARRPWMDIMGQIFPNGLLLRDGAEHKHHRKIMHGAFSRPVLKDYAQRMNPMIEGGIAGWGRDGQLLAFPAFKALTLDIAASIFVGAELGSGNRPMNEAFERMVVASMSRIRLPLPWLEFQRGRQGRAFMMQFLGERMAERRRNPGGDIFSRLCQAETEEGDRFSDQEIIDHMIFLMMAAHDTTTSTLTSLTYELAKNPDWQERIREESRALDTPQPGSEDLERLPSLTLAMRETLRLYPALPVIPRIAVRDFEFGGYQIPGGSMVIVSPIVTHRLKEWWSNPDRFDPERFSNARREHERHTHSWVPFGGGPHMCLGLRFAEAQVRLIMHQMVLRYRWTVPEGYSMPVQQAPISKPRDGLPISIELVH